MNNERLTRKALLCATLLATALAGCGSAGASATNGAGAAGGGAAEGAGGGGDAAGSGGSGGGSAGGSACGTLAQRLTLTQVDVDDDIDYAAPGYNGVPQDTRIALSVQPNGQSQVAWVNASWTKVHVTPLAANNTRRADDTVIDGIDLGGLVAQDDGFAVLTRRPDPGAALGVDGDQTNAAFLVRYQGGKQKFAVPLTGTKGLDGTRDYSNGLGGRLEWNGSKYGAYFVVRGGMGYDAEGHYGDKLIYADDSGKHIAGGWDWNCSHNEGILLLPESGAFTSLCFSDGYPNPGLNLVTEGMPGRQLAKEVTWAGYAGGQFGSVVKLADKSYLVAWLSRGTTTVNGQVNAAKSAPDIAFLHLTSASKPDGALTWVTNTPNVAERSLHVAPYGKTSLLMTWKTIESLKCDGAVCFGKTTGTHARLVDVKGNFSSPDVTLPASVPQWDDIAVFPNGDLGWAFVDADVDTTKPLDKNALPKKRTLTIAHLRSCASN